MRHFQCGKNIPCSKIIHLFHRCQIIGNAHDRFYRAAEFFLS